MTSEDLLAQNEHLQAENAALKQRVVELEAALKEALAQRLVLHLRSGAASGASAG
ncbi:MULTISPECIES: hypothetical protein [Caldilinea]|jgi:hypothetical protein|uniref:Uncharacterized protein n=1 Tax=Caldilinea aerophila (strain DSM 14535 / JCM 11387 / NBRC 104270 / STL-6-O1) TaxID=926550 RepID=I0I144_CALAS|nr:MULTISPECIES: hypothetical protein [Caldilinea]BAL98981.1 hypothetical protein CLDAP_09420 [Caldilinea aerophila DSM 14535 = NBRC 104270]